jgi:hypothetical protein
MSGGLEVRIEWLDAPGVNTPALAATWARYEISVADRCVSQVETIDGTFRRSVYGSLYPLAEWIASNWWTLTSHIRPSAVDTRYWTWPNVRSHPWLSRHNVRGAGDGMAWPDLTLVEEGAITRLVWKPDTGTSYGPVRFATGGGALLRTDQVRRGLATVVDHVLERLAEAGVGKTRLTEEWEAIARAGDDEREFCRTVARLGLDPYSVDDPTATDVIDIAGSLPGELVADFFDSAEASTLATAAEWTKRAMVAASRASNRASRQVSPLYEMVSRCAVADSERPWVTGYAMARQVRHALGTPDTDPFDPGPWVGLGQVGSPSRGVQGIVTVHGDRCGLVLGGPRTGIPTRRFGQARALGRVLAHPQQHSFVLSAARGQNERVAGAFAAELLAPAEGIRRSLAAIGEQSDAAFDAVAGHFRVSPLLVRHQYDNQLAKARPGVLDQNDEGGF